MDKLYTILVFKNEPDGFLKQQVTSTPELFIN